MRVPSLPWFVWAFIAFVVLNMVFDLNLNLIPFLIIGAVVSSVLGVGQTRRRSVPPPQRPSQPPPRPGPVLTGDVPPEPPMSTIDVPTYPGEGKPGSGVPTHGSGVPGQAGGTAYPSRPSEPTTDPVVSLGQLHLGRYARELDLAARAGDRAGVARTLDEVVDLTTRTQQMVRGADGLSGSGRREFGAGLRRLQGEALAARGEDPPGPRVGQVVRGAGLMSQTGRYE